MDHHVLSSFWTFQKYILLQVDHEIGEFMAFIYYLQATPEPSPARIMKVDGSYAGPKLSSPTTKHHLATDSPLSNSEYDSDAYDEFFEVRSDGTDNEIKNGSPKQNRGRIFLWIASSATAMYSSKQLMINHGYPLTIAFRTFAVSGLVYLLSLHLGLETDAVKFWKWEVYQPRRPRLWPSSRWLPMFPAALMSAISLPMFMEGLLHMLSLPVLAMLFPLLYVIESLVLFITCSRSRTQLCLPWETILAIIPLSAILCDEYRLTVQGLIWGPVGIIVTGLARGLFIAASDRTGYKASIEARREVYHGFVSMTLVMGTVFSGMLSYCLEERQPLKTKYTTSATLELTLVNIFSMVATAFSGSFLMAYSPLSFDHASNFSNIPVVITELKASTTSSLLVFIVAIFSGPTIIVSWFQIFAYIIAILCIAGTKNVCKAVTIFTNFAQNYVKPGKFTGLGDLTNPSNIFIVISLTILVTIATIALNIISELPIGHLTSTLQPSLDMSFDATSRFEIVIAIYEESPAAVASLIDDVIHTTFLSTIHKNIQTTIYTKSATDDLDELRNLTGAGKVLRLPNLGREGGTYIHHIVNNWDVLAEQTMFIQAGAHNRREVLPRINTYLNSEIGMLNLGEAGIVCDCLACNDRTGWEDSWDILPTLYSKIHPNETCLPSTKLALSYKGQFIASARRIRGVQKQVYVDLLRAITSTEGWSHDRNIIGTHFDSPDNPFFGFTLERAWGLLMQCATEDIAVKCPTLLSGTLGFCRGGGVEDCGCFD